MNFFAKLLATVFFLLETLWGSKWYNESILVFNIELSDTIC